MTDMHYTLILEIAACAFVAIVLAVGILAWLSDIRRSGRPSHTPVIDVQDYAASIRRGLALHQPARIDDMTTDEVPEDEYSEMLDSLLREIGKKGDVK